MSVIDENWDFILDLHQIEDCYYQEFLAQMVMFSKSVMNLLDEEILGKDCHNKGAKSQNPEDKIYLKVLVEKNRKLKSDIDTKLQELNQKQAEYEHFKQDRKLLSQEIKETHEAFLMAKKFYKKFLRIYYTIEKSTDTHQIIFLQFFTESRKESDDYSVRLQRNIETHIYELLETSPKLKGLDEIQKNLDETHDVPGTLSHIRDCFLKIKTSKK